MKIVFMGTPEFAVRSLERIVKSNHSVVGVVTVPDKKKGRGLKLSASPVKNFAIKNGIPNILQPVRLKDETFLQELKSLNADLFVVVAFRILPEVVFNMPPGGTINLHASLLPDYRGAAPINWAVINGEVQTGVTTFFIKKEVDTGSILLQKKIPILEEDNAGSIHDKLADIGAEILVETIDRLERNDIKATIQPEGDYKKAPKIFPHTTIIDWSLPAERIFNFIRGLSPFPGASTYWKGKKIKIFQSVVVKPNTAKKGEPGQIIRADKHQLWVQTADFPIQIEMLQMPGKKRITTEEALRGYRIQEGEYFYCE